MGRWIVVACAILLFSSSLALGGEAGPAPKMIIEKVSPYGLEETVARIQENVKKVDGWVVSGVRPMDKNIKERGGPDVLPVRLIELCNAQDAGRMLQDDSSRYASVMMPCTISVYTKSDGKTYVAFVNARQVGEMFGGTVGEIMGGPVARDQDKFLEFLK